MHSAIMHLLSSIFPGSHRAKRWVSLFAGLGGLLAGVSFAYGSDDGGWRDLWLPAPRAVHAPAIDAMFSRIFWITAAVCVVVHVGLVAAIVLFRAQPRRTARFVHGNARLEISWTFAAAFILIGLALASERVWAQYRYSPALSGDPGRAKLLVIGQQFKWNVVYAGADHEIGRYLVFPKPTDATWPPYPRDPARPRALTVQFQGVRGPASLPTKQAMLAISAYIEQVNPLGKDFTDPRGLDDDWSPAPGREIVLPAGRAIEIDVASKDVIHDFFLPNFRVKLDAVPGLIGAIYLVADQTSAAREQQSEQMLSIDELASRLQSEPGTEWRVRIDQNTPGPAAGKDHDTIGWRYVGETGGASIIRDGGLLSPAVLDKLRAAGLTHLLCHESGDWNLICEQYCGPGHYTMQNRIRVVPNDEFVARFEKKIPTARASSNTASPAAPLAGTGSP